MATMKKRFLIWSKGHNGGNPSRWFKIQTSQNHNKKLLVVIHVDGQKLKKTGGLRKN